MIAGIFNKIERKRKRETKKKKMLRIKYAFYSFVQKIPIKRYENDCLIYDRALFL